MSVTMAVGARELARRQAVVSHLPAMEELGRHGRAVLGQDRHPHPEPARGGRPRGPRPVRIPPGLLAAAALASRAEDRDPIDLAVLAAAARAGGRWAAGETGSSRSTR